MTSKTTPQAAVEAATKILKLSSIQVPDQKLFAAGLVELLSNYPRAVTARAASVCAGIPGKQNIFSLADIKAYLDTWHAEHHADLRRSKVPLIEHREERDLVEVEFMKRKFDDLMSQLKKGTLGATVEEDREKRPGDYERIKRQMRAEGIPI